MLLQGCRMSTLTGKVTDTRHVALPGASVVADGPTRSNVLTDSGGRYEMAGLAPGAYAVAASAYQHSPSRVSVVTLGADRGVDFRLRVARRRKGR